MVKVLYTTIREIFWVLNIAYEIITHDTENFSRK